MVASMNTSESGIPRIEPVTDPDEEQAALLSKTLTRSGKPLLVFSTLAHHPRLLKRFNALGGLFITGLVPDRERELIILRVAGRVECDYEFAQHVLLGRGAGLTDEEIINILNDDRDWSEADRLLLQFTDEMLAQDRASGDVLERLQARYTTQQLLELLLLPGFYRMLAAALRTIELSGEEDLPTSPSLSEAISLSTR